MRRNVVIAAVATAAAVAVATVGLSGREISARRPAALLGDAPDSVFAALEEYNGPGSSDSHTGMSLAKKTLGGFQPYLFPDMQDMYRGQGGMGRVDMSGVGVQDDAQLKKLRRLLAERNFLAKKKVVPAERPAFSLSSCWLRAPLERGSPGSATKRFRLDANLLTRVRPRVEPQLKVSLPCALCRRRELMI
jgi:hypothetical protein